MEIWRQLCRIITPQMPDPITVLEKFMARIPGIETHMGTGEYEDGCWWMKFSIDIDHPLAWNVVQELGHVVNYLSVNERLPALFYPVSPPPYMNGGPKEFLSWVIESRRKDFFPKELVNWLEARLPNPVDDESQWEEENSCTQQGTCRNCQWVGSLHFHFYIDPTKTVTGRCN